MRIRAVLLLVAAGSLLPVAVVDAAEDPLEELQETRDQLEEAGRDLEQLEHELDVARARIEEIDTRLARVTGELAAIRDDLAAAQDRLEDANQREREAAAALQTATDDLGAHVTAWEDNQQRLDARVTEIYKHGSSRPAQLLAEGIVRSKDLHSVTVTVRTVEGIVERDRELVRSNIELAKLAADARARFADARRVTLRERRVVADEVERIEELVARQERLVAEVERERQERASILATIATDRATQVVLIRRLEERVEELADELFQAILTEQLDIPFDGPMPAWAAGLPNHGRQWAPAINAAASAVGLDGRLFAALVWTESNFHPAAVSSAGAIGLSQLMPATAESLGVDPWDPLQNLAGGARYLRAMVTRFGTADLALAAYNAGPGAVEAAGNQIPDIVETQLYVLAVLERYERLLGAG
ncbi:MAG: transglycosylase SLT domain-containing protein [Nitriliruptorales bacterium]|nr:transglycosylase SLT domain-containing protein [Nitriliruptorales bacterium]